MDAVKVKKIQNLQTQMACEVKRICEKYDIAYFLCCGTLLGAVRHQAPIPWDDDLDIGFLRDDYEKFLSVVESELNSKYYIQTWHNDKNYALPHAKLRNKGTRYIEKICKDSGCGDEINIDLLPFDKIPDDEDAIKLHGDNLILLINVIKLKRNWLLSSYDNENKKLTDKYIKHLNEYTQELAISLYEEAVIKYNNSNMKNITETAGDDYFRFITRAEYYQSLIIAKYDGENFNIPEDYHKILSDSYNEYLKIPYESDRTGQLGILDVIITEEKV